MPSRGTITFAKRSATNDAGHTGSIGDIAWSNDEITRVNNSLQVKAQPSGLKKGGKTFTVEWVRTQ